KARYSVDAPPSDNEQASIRGRSGVGTLANTPIFPPRFHARGILAKKWKEQKNHRVWGFFPSCFRVRYRESAVWRSRLTTVIACGLVLGLVFEKSSLSSCERLAGCRRRRGEISPPPTPMPRRGNRGTRKTTTQRSRVSIKSLPQHLPT